MTHREGSTLGASISTDVDQNLQAMRYALGSSVDLIYREFTCGYRGGTRGLLVFIDGLAEGAAVQDVLAATVRFTSPPYQRPGTEADPVLDLKSTIIHAIELRTSQSLSDAVNGVLNGEAALFLDGSKWALIVDTRYSFGRSVEEPATEAEVRGPRDGLVENIRVNTALLRRRIRDPQFRVESLIIGRRTRTDVAIAYIAGLADPGVVEEVRLRLQRIDIDGVLGSGYLEELIQDNPLSPIVPVMSTERPDRVVAGILEGRVAILVDNTPFAMIVPVTFWQYLQAPGDYYHNYWSGTAFRMIRLIAFFMALTLPALFTILTTYHHEMLPTPLALAIASGREGTPLPTLFEVLLMQVMFEVMHEAGLRLPRAVGQTVSIVGALVIGEAAVSAGLASPGTVIVIATAGVTGYAIPSYSLSLVVRLLRIPLLLLSGLLGVFGFLGGTAFLLLHLASLRSFGQPFMAPFAPVMMAELKDTVVRAPWWAMHYRPKVGKRQPGRRQAANGMPRPGRHGGGVRQGQSGEAEGGDR